MQTTQQLRKATKDHILRTPPHSLEAEQAVLAGLILRPKAAPILILDLAPEDFYFPQHQELFSALRTLSTQNTPLDLVTITQLLRDTHKLEAIGGVVYLSELTQGVVNSANAEFYAKIVKEKATQRTLIEAGAAILSSGYDTTKELPVLIDQAEQAILKVSTKTHTGSFIPIHTILTEISNTALNPSKDGITGLPTGYKDLDTLTRGFQPSDLIIIAARPAMGKTALALNIALRASITHKASVGIFSLEMSSRQLTQRMVSIWGKIPYDCISTGCIPPEEKQRFFETIGRIEKAPIYINETPALSSLELRSHARRLTLEHGLDLIIIDYLQLMRSSRRTDSRELEISEISRALKGLAKELNIPIIALSQLNRKLEERADKHPLLSDLRESGAIEQDADLVMFIYRDEVYNKKPDAPKKGIAELTLGKHRNGPTGHIELAFLPQYTAFEALDVSNPLNTTKYHTS